MWIDDSTEEKCQRGLLSTDESLHRRETLSTVSSLDDIKGREAEVIYMFHHGDDMKRAFSSPTASLYFTLFISSCCFCWFGNTSISAQND